MAKTFGLRAQIDSLTLSLEYERRQLAEEREKRYAAEARVPTLERAVTDADARADNYQRQTRDLTIRNAELSGYVQRVYEVDRAAAEPIVQPAAGQVVNSVPYPTVLERSAMRDTAGGPMMSDSDSLRRGGSRGR